MRYIICTAAMFAIAGPALAQEPQPPLRLTCTGQAQVASGGGSQYRSGINPVTGKAEITTTSAPITRSSVAGSVLVEIAGAQSRIRLPDFLIPSINAGGKDGWWPLTDINLTSDTFTARFKLNPIDRRWVRIDRRSGVIDADRFSGTCERDELAVPKF